jgi:predicted metal-dependent hydrolase
VIVEQHKEWVRETLSAVCGVPSSGRSYGIPEGISLRGGVESRSVICLGEETPDAGAIRLRALRTDTAGALRELRGWVLRHAADVLGEEARTLARRYSLPYASLRFRRQKSRWGSCTAKRTLSLNICLVFLPAELARHVILHELAHTRHMDHGQGFWKTLFALEPNALKLDKRLRAAWRFVPAWIWA